MVGLRVFDVGGLIIWLVWFFKLRDDDADDEDDGPGGSGPPEPDAPDSPPDGGLPLPMPDAQPWPRRRRDHNGDRDARRRCPGGRARRPPCRCRRTAGRPARGVRATAAPAPPVVCERKAADSAPPPWPTPSRPGAPRGRSAATRASSPPRTSTVSSPRPRRRGSKLRRAVGALDLTALGIGAIIGTGIFVDHRRGDRRLRACDRPLVRARGRDVHVLRALLRRARVVDPGLRHRLHLLLRDDRRAGRLDHRLGPDPRIRRLGRRRRGRLGRVPVNDLPRLGCSASRCPRRSPSRRATAASFNLPAVFIVLAVAALLIAGVRECARAEHDHGRVKLAILAFFIVRRVHRLQRRALHDLRAPRLQRRGGRAPR